MKALTEGMYSVGRMVVWTQQLECQSVPVDQPRRWSVMFAGTNGVYAAYLDGQRPINPQSGCANTDKLYHV